MNHLPTRSPARPPALAVLVAAALFLTGCVAVPQQRIAEGEAPTVLGPAVRDNITPLEPVLACYADHIAASGRQPIVISVGDVKDYTGKYSVNEGNAITQGGALMVYSALGKLGGTVRIAERFDPVVAERELTYADRRQLGDGRQHQLGAPGAPGAQVVPWMPYFGGTIHKSDYFIVGGITELNYNINSGGGEIGKNQVGVKARTFTQSVGVDLRIVDTRTLMVLRTVSLTKQFNGYEVGINVFRFFNNDMWDVDIGAKGQEPLQLGVRAALEEGVVRLLGVVTQVDNEPCLGMRPGAGERLSGKTADQMRRHPTPISQQVSAIPVAVSAVGATPLDSRSTGAASSGDAIQVRYDIGASGINGAALSMVEQIAAAATRGPVQVVLVASDTENWDARKRDTLIDERIASLVSALANRGIPPGAITQTWRPAASDNSIHRDGPGLQEIAKLRVEASPRAAGNRS